MNTPVLPQIKNIVFLMLENRSLDNLLGWLYRDGQPAHVFPPGSPATYDGLIAGKYSNPAYVWTGKVKHYPVVPVPAKHAKDNQRIPAYDPYEEFRATGWKGVMNQLFGNQDEIKGLPKPRTHARMLGFLQDYYAKYMVSWQGLDILWTYLPDQLPVINGLARQFAVSDRWFCSVPSQTNPNRAFSLCGTSLGRESNLRITAVEQFNVPTIFNALSAAGKRWGLYYTDTWQQGKSYTEYTFPHISKVKKNGETGDIGKFLKRAEAGTLPDFTYLEPKWGFGKGAAYKQGTDYHPPTHVLPGEQFLNSVYTALRNGPQWDQTLLIVTFDEHGGTYDHVPPAWNAINPDGKKGKDGFNFNLFGARVPTILVSPFVSRSTVFRAPTGSKYPFDHTSFIKTLLLWAGVDPASAGFGKRMPAAPTFEGIFQDDIVNDAPLIIGPALESQGPTQEAGAPAIQGELPHAGPLDELFKGIDFVGTRAIIDANDSIAGMLADIRAYKKDPAKYLRKYSSAGSRGG
jgi:phospholipase C